jgi:hypothetical protein
MLEIGSKTTLIRQFSPAFKRRLQKEKRLMGCTMNAYNGFDAIKMPVGRKRSRGGLKKLRRASK